MSNVNFELVSPERLLMSEGVASVTVPGEDGEFTVLGEHAPVISTLRPGIVNIVRDDGSSERIFVRGGFAETGGANLIILAEEAVPLSELDSAGIASAIRNAEEDVADAKTDAARAAANLRLDQLREVDAVITRG